MHQTGQGIRPKSPHRAQHPGKGAEEQHRAARGPQEHKAPQLALSAPQEKEEGGRAHGQAVDPVQRGGKPGRPQAEGAQQIVQHPRGQAQQDGLPEHQKLLGDLVPHAYPNRRPKKPRRPGPSSS